jgi:hypothetical protein
MPAAKDSCGRRTGEEAMKSSVQIALALSLCFPALLAPASAAPPRIEGERCYFPVERGTWVGFFDGGYEETSFTGRDVIRQVTIWRCFGSKAACTAWKYWAQTDYDKGPQVTWCRRK